MKDVDLILTDEFCLFSAEIAKIHDEKKKLKEEFKKLYDDYQAKVAGLDARASDLLANWEAWKVEHAKGKKGA